MDSIPILSILIPCYNQPHLLHRCLSSIRNQKLKDFVIIIMDDCSNISYEKVIEKNNDLPISYLRNTTNLGAVPNMIYCINYPVITKYKIVFHEDDIMYPSLLEDEAGLHDKNELGWVGSNMSFFSKMLFFENNEEKEVLIFRSQVKDLVSLLLEGNALSLGSVMYRTDITGNIKIDLEKYSMLGDRQMLLELAKQHGCGYLNYNLVAANDHGINDTRWKNLRRNHIQNYYSYMANYFETKELKNKNMAADFTHAFVSAFKLLPPSFQTKKTSFYWKAYQDGLFSLKYFLLSFKSIRHIGDFMKSIIRK